MQHKIFSKINQPAEKASLTVTALEIKCELQKLSKVTLIPSMWLGLSIFSVDNQNELHVSLCSLPSLIAAIRFIFARLLGVFYNIAAEQFYELFVSVSHIESISQTLFAISIYFTDIINLLLMVKNYKKVIQFQNHLNNFFVESITLISENLQTSFDILRGDVAHLIKRFRMLQVLICMASIICSATSMYSLKEAMLRKPRDTWTWKTYVMPVYVMFWSFSSTVRFISRMWVLQLIILFRTGTVILVNHLKLNSDEKENSVSNIRKKKLDEQIQLVVRQYKKLEVLVENFNKVLGTFISVDMLSFIVLIFATLFEVMVWISRPNLKLAYFSFAMTGFFSCVMTWLFCDVSHKFEKQVSNINFVYSQKIMSVFHVCVT